MRVPGPAMRRAACSKAARVARYPTPMARASAKGRARGGNLSLMYREDRGLVRLSIQRAPLSLRSGAIPSIWQYSLVVNRTSDPRTGVRTSPKKPFPGSSSTGMKSRCWIDFLPAPPVSGGADRICPNSCPNPSASVLSASLSAVRHESRGLTPNLGYTYARAFSFLA